MNRFTPWQDCDGIDLSVVFRFLGVGLFDSHQDILDWIFDDVLAE